MVPGALQSVLGGVFLRVGQCVSAKPVFFHSYHIALHKDTKMIAGHEKGGGPSAAITQRSEIAIAIPTQTTLFRDY